MTKPFEILSGGYQIIFKNNKWSQVFASETKKKAFAKEDRRGHRTETREFGKLLRTSILEVKKDQKGVKAAMVKRASAGTR